MSKKLLVIIISICLISFFLSFYRKTEAPPCINTDEATVTYNAYSILKTGRDEYGKLFPLRFQSFGDFKMPLQFYLSIPTVAVFGLNDFSVRLTNSLIALVFPLAVYFLTLELFLKKRIALLASFLSATSFGILMLGRQQHEGYTAGLLITLTSLFFLKVLRKQSTKNCLLFFLTLFLSLFTYHSSRIFAIFFLGYGIVYFLIKKIKTKLFFLIFLVVLGLFFATDIVYSPTRIKNLLFFNNIGLGLTVSELRGEGGARLIYNKATVSVLNLTYEYLKYFSPQFLAINGDENVKFGFKNLPPLTPVVYIFIFIGLYFLFKKKEKERFFILTLFLVAPLSASLSWASSSLTRSYFILIPAIIFSAYGFYNFSKSLNQRFKILIVSLLILLQFIFLFFSWDFYLNHYPKRAIVIRAWQCGNKEMAEYVGENYNRFDHFYITKQNGQPYIFLLFYLKYLPQKYQSQANLSASDKYGFGQVEQFDKFNFNFKQPKELEKKAVTIGFPEDFSFSSVTNVKKIKIGTEEIFWIYENP